MVAPDWRPVPPRGSVGACGPAPSFELRTWPATAMPRFHWLGTATIPAQQPKPSPSRAPPLRPDPDPNSIPGKDHADRQRQEEEIADRTEAIRLAPDGALLHLERGQNLAVSDEWLQQTDDGLMIVLSERFFDMATKSSVPIYVSVLQRLCCFPLSIDTATRGCNNACRGARARSPSHGRRSSDSPEPTTGTLASSDGSSARP